MLRGPFAGTAPKQRTASYSPQRARSLAVGVLIRGPWTVRGSAADDGSGNHASARYAVVVNDAEFDSVISKAIAGDRNALSQLLELAAPVLRARLSSAIAQELQSMLTLDDLLQETYADAAQALGDFKPTGYNAFLAWLETIARRNLIDAARWLRSRGAGQNVSMSADRDDSLDALYLDMLSTSASTPSRFAARNEMRGYLESAIAQLGSIQRNVIEKHDLRGVDTGQIAAELGRSVGAVYLIRNRALRRLRELMGDSGLFFSVSS